MYVIPNKSHADISIDTPEPTIHSWTNDIIKISAFSFILQKMLSNWKKVLITINGYDSLKGYEKAYGSLAFFKTEFCWLGFPNLTSIS